MYLLKVILDSKGLDITYLKNDGLMVMPLKDNERLENSSEIFKLGSEQK